MATFVLRGVVCAVLAMFMVVPSLATVYTVGDTGGWTMGNDYSTWSSGKTFAVGDSLVFNYGGGHTVDEVSGSDYNTCTIGNSITSDQSSPTTITLKTAGTHYYICGVPGHCGSGMKLAVTVAAAGSSTPPSSSSGTPSSSAGTSTTTSPSTSSSNTTSIYRPASNIPESSAGAVSPFVAVVATWLAFCLMFFF
ncbi:hypothetical protein K2173_007927 [Erythroxylum novogranatense]|uniref:Phytocyanin domain-containing protein n=1 Tax=Erythroxylum novogranatense TaxID=1862640 RepID=A0AAV8T8H9_9ROSI|nr:hypothetical protein K2173_007927 [Erythroxylum novogranatense]